jgi:putative transposase
LRAQREEAREDAKASDVQTSRRACAGPGSLPRFHDRPIDSDQQRDEPIRARLIELAQEKPRFGYRRLLVPIRWGGMIVNHKRLFRIYRAARLSAKRKRRKRLVRACSPRTRPTAPRVSASTLRHASKRAMPISGENEDMNRSSV